MIQEYLVYLAMKGCTEGTRIGMNKTLNALYCYTNAGMNTTEDQIMKYSIWLKRKGLKKSTINLRMHRIKGYFKYLKKEGHILFDPAEDIKVERIKNLPQNIPSHEQIEMLMIQPDTETLIGKRDRAILELLYTSAIRKREVTNLDIYDVNLKKKEIFIREGKGRRDRVVPIGEEAIKWLNKYIEIVRKRYIKDPEEKALFISGLTGRRLKHASIYDVIERYRDKIKDGQRLSPHRIRHACAIGMLRNGANIRIIQKMLGHKRLDTTQIYTKLNIEDLKTAHHKYHPRDKMKP